MTREEMLKQLEWIPITKQTPPPFTKVLMTIKEKAWSREKGYYDNYIVVYRSYRGSKKVVAWKYGPEPYKEENKE